MKNKSYIGVIIPAAGSGSRMGGVYKPLEKLCGKDVWFDLSFGYGVMPKAIAQEIVDKHTPERLVFASDMPWHRPSWEKQLIESLDISKDDKDKIYYKNALKLLKIWNAMEWAVTGFYANNYQNNKNMYKKLAPANTV